VPALLVVLIASRGQDGNIVGEIKISEWLGDYCCTQKKQDDQYG